MLTMAQPRDLRTYAVSSGGGRTWRIAHLSDIHTVGERYGFRIESGRSGPRGNERLRQTLARLEEIHAAQPLDVILITGDLTDAGRSAEWAEFFAAFAAYPRLAELVVALPGNHDVNVVDRAKSCPNGLADEPHQATAPGPYDIRPRHAAGHAAPCRGRARTVGSVAAWQTRCSRMPPTWPPSPTQGRHVCRDHWLGCGPRYFQWCCRPTRTMGWGSSC